VANINLIKPVLRRLKNSGYAVKALLKDNNHNHSRYYYYHFVLDAEEISVEDYIRDRGSVGVSSRAGEPYLTL
jgi:predicted fused transcriptional regulator/phosphomethylpyrimidine kinase